MTYQTYEVTIDLRGYDFETVAELQHTVLEILHQIDEDTPDVKICGFVLSRHQQRMLNLERYLNGEPIASIKSTELKDIGGVPVITADTRTPIRCIASHIHDHNEPWYPHE